MDVLVKPCSSLNGEINVPTSKSYTIRALLSAMLSSGKSVVSNPLISRDTRACMNVCEQLGARLRLNESHVFVGGVSGMPFPKKDLIDCMNSGTTLRLATAIASLSDKPVSFTGDDSLRSRPIQQLVDALGQVGVKAEAVNGNPPVKVEGPMTGGTIEIPGNISSQYISALLMSTPCAREDSIIKITSPLKSAPYVDLTLDVLGKFGVKVKNNDYESFFIQGGQTYKPIEYNVEGDFSSAAFFLVAASLTQGEVTLNNLNPNSLQADKKILKILEDMSASITINKDNIVVGDSTELTGIKIDLSDSPDLLPIVSVLGCHAEGETEIVNTEHARVKECDRIAAMSGELKKMGANLEEKPDGMIISKTRLKGCVVNGWNDHRIIMSLSVAALNATGDTTITGGEHVDVTYPDFFKHLTTLGGKVK